jgi:hypothetical protein
VFREAGDVPEGGKSEIVDCAHVVGGTAITMISLMLFAKEIPQAGMAETFFFFFFLVLRLSDNRIEDGRKDD